MPQHTMYDCACVVQAALELELIERLKSKQAEQRKAYQQLEAVLQLGNTRCGALIGQ